MLALDRGAAQIALAVDGDGRLIGVVTDGDIRRALLAGATLDDPLATVLTRDSSRVGPGEGRAAALELHARAAGSGDPGRRRPTACRSALHLLHEFLSGPSVRTARSSWPAAGGRASGR